MMPIPQSVHHALVKYRVKVQLDRTLSTIKQDKHQTINFSSVTFSPALYREKDPPSNVTPVGKWYRRDLIHIKSISSTITKSRIKFPAEVENTRSENISLTFLSPHFYYPLTFYLFLQKKGDHRRVCFGCGVFFKLCELSFNFDPLRYNFFPAFARHFRLYPYSWATGKW